MTPDDTIALDTNCFVHLLEDPRDRRARFLEQEVLRPALRGERALTTSALTIAELLVVAYRAGEPERAAALRAALAAFDGLRIVDIDESIAARAAQLRGTSGLTLPDAIHLASAAATADGLLTNDRRLVDAGHGLQVWYLDAQLG